MSCNEITSVVIGIPGPPGKAILGTAAVVDNYTVALNTSVTSGMGVMLVDSVVLPSMADTLAQANAFLGISQGAGSNGDIVPVVSYGVASGVSFVPGNMVYLANSGVLSQTLPISGVYMVLGSALDTQSIVLRPLQPIQL